MTPTPGAGAASAASAAADVLAAAARIVGSEHVAEAVRIEDASGARGVAPAVAHPSSAEEVRELVAWAYAHDVPILPVGGASGYSGGVVPVTDGPLLGIALDRLNRVRSFDPLLWRIEVEAGVTTATVARLARENGLLFPPDPGAPEQSQIGGNLATNAGGPHAFRYGVTSRWVTGVEAVLAPGELAYFGGPLRKDVAGYDLRSLLIGSEGTLGIITAAWLRLVPAPEERVPIVAAYGSIEAGCSAVERVLGSGVVPAALEFLEGRALVHAPPPFINEPGAFLVIAEAESEHEQHELLEALGQDALGEGAFAADPQTVWRWREGIGLVLRGVRGEKLAEDIAVPLDRIREAIERTLAIGAIHDLETCTFGHIGDGNLHSTFLFDPADADAVRRSQAAAEDLFALARELSGTVSGEHGLGLLKNGQMVGQWSDAAIAAHETIKRALDPKGLFNPGKKLAR